MCSFKVCTSCLIYEISKVSANITRKEEFALFRHSRTTLALIFFVHCKQDFNTHDNHFNYILKYPSSSILFFQLNGACSNLLCAFFCTLTTFLRCSEATRRFKSYTICRTKLACLFKFPRMTCYSSLLVCGDYGITSSQLKMTY